MTRPGLTRTQTAGDCRPAGTRLRFAAALAAAALALSTACTRPDYSKGSISYKPSANSNAQTGTPAGDSQPRTALPMPPVAASHGSRGAGADDALTTSTWKTLDGRDARPSDYRGRVLVLDFWATYCPPCREQTPHLIALQRRYGPQGLQIVGLNVGGEDDRPKVASYVEEFGIQYPLGYPDDAMNQLYFADNDAIPQTYVFDRRGRLLKRFVGYDRTMPAELEELVKTALSN